MPRLYREAPLNSIWEGSGNVACLDVLRAMVQEPRSRSRSSTTRSSRRPARMPASATRCPGCSAELSDFESARRAPVTSSSGWRSPCRVRCSCATATGGRRRVLRVTAGGRLGSRLRHAAGGHRPPGDHRSPPAGRELAPDGEPVRVDVVPDAPGSRSRSRAAWTHRHPPATASRESPPATGTSWRTWGSRRKLRQKTQSSGGNARSRAGPTCPTKAAVIPTALNASAMCEAGVAQ